MHHQRRKSGHSTADSSTTDVRRTVGLSDMTKHKRPSMGRRQTPASSQKLGRSHREREREIHDSWDDERESFPQFCMTCEKQFMPHDEMHLYCSDSCRRVDQASTSSHAATVRDYSSVSYSTYPSYSLESSEPRDIVPRASPSRPCSMHYSTSPPESPGTSKHYPSALTALRSLNTRPPSPPSPAESSGGIWPFGRSSATSPSNSYSRPSSSFFSSTYDSGYGGGGYTYDVGSVGVDYRPLPSRHPAGYSSRPKSIELVTPMIGR